MKNSLPTYCPKCGEPLKWEGVHLICAGKNCLAKKIVSISYFYSEKGIKIDDIGEKTIERLLHNTKCYNILIESPWALLDSIVYDISSDLLSILGEKIYINLLNQVEQKNKQFTMAHFISGLGLPKISYKTTLRLCQYIKTGKLNMAVSKEAMNNFLKGTLIFNKAKVEMENFQFAPLPEMAKAIYCITGTLSQSRSDMIEYLSEYGYEFSRNVTQETSYLIVGADPGELKKITAKKNNIPQITEEQFINLLTKEN